MTDHRPVHQAETILLTHLQDPASTIASVGALYALCIAARPRFGAEEWTRIHAAIRARFQPADDAAWYRQMDRIKKAGWRLHDALIGAFPSPLTGGDGDG